MSTPRFHSQCGEDRWIIENLKPEVGQFCEVGAFDGIQSSNTLAFEDLGWSGICVEADPVLAAQCANNRKCETICCAAGLASWSIVDFWVNEQDRGLSGIHQPWEKEIHVPLVKLAHILDVIGGCDLLSIDTEGTEINVWASIEEYRPSIVIMEYQTRDLPSQEAAIVNEMTESSYVLVHKTQYNLIFRRD